MGDRGGHGSGFAGSWAGFPLGCVTRPAQVRPWGNIVPHGENNGVKRA